MFVGVLQHQHPRLIPFADSQLLDQSLATMADTPGKMYALATVLVLLATVAVMLRLYARRKTKQCILWDDYLVLLALVSISLSCLAMKPRAKSKFRSSRLGRQFACLLVRRQHELLALSLTPNPEFRDGHR